MTREKALAELLGSLFIQVADLRRWLYFSPQGPALVNELPGGSVDMAEYTFQAVLRLAAAGLVNAEFFSRLAYEPLFKGRRADILHAASLWGVNDLDARVSPKPELASPRLLGWLRIPVMVVSVIGGVALLTLGLHNLMGEPIDEAPDRPLTTGSIAPPSPEEVLSSAKPATSPPPSAAHRTMSPSKPEAAPEPWVALCLRASPDADDTSTAALADVLQQRVEQQRPEVPLVPCGTTNTRWTLTGTVSFELEDFEGIPNATRCSGTASLTLKDAAGTWPPRQIRAKGGDSMTLSHTSPTLCAETLEALATHIMERYPG